MQNFLLRYADISFNVASHEFCRRKKRDTIASVITWKELHLIMTDATDLYYREVTAGRTLYILNFNLSTALEKLNAQIIFHEDILRNFCWEKNFFLEFLSKFPKKRKFQHFVKRDLFITIGRMKQSKERIYMLEP